MYLIRPRQLPSIDPHQLDALDRRWRLAAQQRTFRNPETEVEQGDPFRPRLYMPHRRQRPPC